MDYWFVNRISYPTTFWPWLLASFIFQPPWYWCIAMVSGVVEFTAKYNLVHDHSSFRWSTFVVVSSILFSWPSNFAMGTILEKGFAQAQVHTEFIAQKPKAQVLWTVCTSFRRSTFVVVSSVQLTVESHDLSQAEEMHKITTLFTKNGPRWKKSSFSVKRIIILWICSACNKILNVEQNPLTHSFCPALCSNCFELLKKITIQRQTLES